MELWSSVVLCLTLTGLSSQGLYSAISGIARSLRPFVFRSGWPVLLACWVEHGKHYPASRGCEEVCD